MQLRFVLVVENEFIIAAATQRELEQAGYKAAIAMSGEEASCILRHGDPDVVLLDLTLRRKLDGLAIAQALTARGIKVVVTSGYGPEVLSEAALSAELVSYLSKPYSRDQLLASVESALAPKA